MSINYIPNDPDAGVPGNRVINPHIARPPGLAGFNMPNGIAEGLFNPPSEEFLFWQCREAALRAFDLWEAIDAPLAAWQGGRARIELIHKVQGDNRLNAAYDRRSLSFYEFATGGRVFLSGISTDVVAHEAGHAFLDAIRPDLWSSLFGEQGAFHEAFGDCIAILTALTDLETRQALIAGGLVRQANFVEGTAENLSAGIATVNPAHNAARPRRALNTFQWQLPGTLPVTGGPGALINEVHSLGMLFSGMFYDTLTNIYTAGADASEAGLQTAAMTAGRLLVAGARAAPLQPRFFKAVGNAMVIADRDLHAGAHEQAVVDAFAAHAIDLDVAAMVAPTALLAGRAPSAAATSTAEIITRASRRNLLAEIGSTPGQRIVAEPRQLGTNSLYSAWHQHKVPLDDVSDRLSGVVALVEEEVLIGEVDGVAAALGAVPTVSNSTAEVQSFVHGLMEHGQIEFEESDRPGADLPTHKVKESGDNRVLSRIQFNCRCGSCGWPARRASS